MKLSNYLESKLRKVNVSYSFSENGSLTLICNKSGETWHPMIQAGGKYKRGFWKHPF